MLKLKNIIAGYRDKVVLNDISVAFDPTKITVVMGPNGCGKTTLLRVIMGLLRPMSGVISPSLAEGPQSHWYRGDAGEGKKCTGEKSKPSPETLSRFGPSAREGLSPRAWAAHGVFMIGQGGRVFPTMTVRENIEIAFIPPTGGKAAAPAFAGVTERPARGELFSERLGEVLAHFPDLRMRLDDPAGNLSGGQQQMVALCRGLINRPKLLLLDEPSIGLSPKLISDTFHKLREINKRTGCGFIIVEHNLKTLLPLTDHAVILANGKIAYDGKSDGKTLQNMIDKIF
ncbi:MAG: ATP-binding cassette domain-containing protein [Rickettsiales bacterium]|jgi:branched-chain amino acid transport system ATP-binding protein|nr:ATP-binding cassette domain-containing protein [Rickettsiales bacterium]